jgi:hypothetical protein
VIEIVDAEDKVDTFLPVVDELVTEGLVTLEAVRIVRYVSPGRTLIGFSPNRSPTSYLNLGGRELRSFQARILHANHLSGCGPVDCIDSCTNHHEIPAT